ncbi:MAG TPA: hypothetical protein VGQ83_15505 [Polyangia bacterium]
MDSAPATDDRRLGLGLLGVSFVVLSYEVTQLRVFAYSLNPVLVYTGVAITMLGFGLASTVLTLWKRLAAVPAATLGAAASLGLAVSGAVANVVFALASPGISARTEVTGSFTAASLSVIILCTLPYACGGLLVAVVLSRRTAASGRFYFLNLVGSGVGCFVINFALRPLGAERLVTALLALAALCGALLAGRTAPRLRAAALVTGLALAAVAPVAPRLIEFAPDAADQHAIMAAAYRAAGAGAPVREYSVWDPVAKVDIHSWAGQTARLPAPVPFKMLTQDSGAASLLVAVGQDPARGARLFGDTIYSTALKLRTKPRVLVVGPGGGSDVQAALHHGAARITAVEINAATVRAVRDTFADFLGRPYAQPGVAVVNADGRSFLRRTEEKFDIIQMSGVDTLTVQAASSYVFAEEYLYTVDAFQDYLRALADDGLLSIVRFGREPYRLSVLAAAALRRIGVVHPEQHMLILQQSMATLLLIKRTPFTAVELATVARSVAASGAANAGLGVHGYDVMDLRLGAPLRRIYAPGAPDGEPVYQALFAAIAAGQTPNVAVPTDDCPYYFIAEWVGFFQGQSYGPVAPVLGVYVRFVGILLAVALALIVLPAAVLRGRHQRGRRSLAALGYFFSLGFCYMLLEIALIQKAVLVVEHPAYSVSVVLASLLLASALGSLLSQRLRLAPRTIVLGAAAVIAVVGGGYAFGLGAIFRALMPLAFPVRMLLVALLVAPLGCAMGTLFPLGLRQLGDRGARLVPWAIAVNGFASVIGSVLSLPGAVLFGFTALFAGGVALYVIGSLAFLGLGPAAAPPGAPPAADAERG